MSYIARATSGYLPTLSPAALVEQNQNMTLEDRGQSADPQSNSVMLKQRLELYWQEMVKYQEELKKEQAKQKCQQVLKYQPPEVIEQAKNIVKAMLENDNLQSNILMPTWANSSTNENPQFNSTSTSGNDSTSKNGSFSPGNLCRSPTMSNRKATDPQPLDLSAPVTGKNRPVAETVPKHLMFLNHIQSKASIPLDENRNHVLNNKPYSLPPTSSAQLDYQNIMRARFSQAQANHLQHWLVKQNSNASTDDISPNKRQKMEQTNPFVPHRGNNAMVPQPFASKDSSYIHPNHVFPVPKIPHSSFTTNRPFLPQQMQISNPKSSPSAVTPSPSQNPAQVNGKRYKRYAKPPYSYVSLISLSILSSPEKKLRLSQILKRISEMFPFFNGSYQGWRDSVRHNLSQNECFVKVLKNPFRPTAKGNYWTINLSSIPHELLLRQNTLVSRYAQDSGYRYRKDLSEVFDLTTGEIKVKISNHLLNHNVGQNHRARLVADPAAVMEFILLEETYDDDHNTSQNSQLANNLHFSLQDLFVQDETGEDDSGRGRMKGNRNQKSSPTNAAMNPSLAAYINHAKNPYLNHASQMSTAMQTAAKDSAMNQNQMPAVLDRQMLAFQMLQNAISSNNMMMASASQQQTPQNAAAFVAAQNALLSKALSAKMNNPLLQNMLYAANQMNMAQNTLSPPAITDNQTSEEQRTSLSPNSDKSDVEKRNKRKGKPMRRSSAEQNDLDVATTIESISSSSIRQVCDTEKSPSDEPGSLSFNMPTSSPTIKNESTELYERNNRFPITSTQQQMACSETVGRAFPAMPPMYASPIMQTGKITSPSQNECNGLNEQNQSQQQQSFVTPMSQPESSGAMMPGFQAMPPLFSTPAVHPAKI